MSKQLPNVSLYMPRGRKRYVLIVRYKGQQYRETAGAKRENADKRARQLADQVDLVRSGLIKWEQLGQHIADRIGNTTLAGKINAAIAEARQPAPLPAGKQSTQTEPDDDIPAECILSSPRPAPPKPAPVPAVIETPEEVAERVVTADGGWVTVGYLNVPAHGGSFFGTSALRTIVQSVIARIIRERDAAHAAQLAQAREASIDEAASVADANEAWRTAAVIRSLKARPVAAGGK